MTSLLYRPGYAVRAYHLFLDVCGLIADGLGWLGDEARVLFVMALRSTDAFASTSVGTAVSILFVLALLFIIKFPSVSPSLPLLCLFAAGAVVFVLGQGRSIVAAFAGLSPRWQTVTFLFVIVVIIAAVIDRWYATVYAPIVSTAAWRKAKPKNS